MQEALHKALKILTKEENELIRQLFFANNGKGMTEREYAAISGIPQKTINDRKLRILGKLKKILEN